MSIQNHVFIQSFSDIDNSRNPKIATFLKTYYYVKEYGEGVDRMCRELIANGVKEPKYHTDDFILKITVPRVTVLGDKVTTHAQKPNRNRTKIIDNVADASGISTTKSNNGKNKVTEKVTEKDSKLIEKASINGDRLTENKLSILQYMMDDPYISRSDLAKYVGISENSISRNIEAMRGKYLRLVGPDKGGFWEVLMD